MHLYGLIGYPLEHSFSKSYFEEKFKKEWIEGCRYELFPLQAADQVTDLILQNPDLMGLNVTVPHKQGVLNHLDRIDGEAYEVGAVNTIKIYRGKLSYSLKGFNTDIIAFERSIKPLIESQHKKALILGSGGSARAVSYELEKMGIDNWFVSRKPSEKAITYEYLDQQWISECKLIINTTPLGMYPQTEYKPSIFYECLTEEHLLYDLIYNPSKTAFLEEGQQAGATIKNGLEMLNIQAEESWAIWNNPNQ
jgi:shikimate dehydrogenase